MRIQKNHNRFYIKIQLSEYGVTVVQKLTEEDE